MNEGVAVCADAVIAFPGDDLIRLPGAKPSMIFPHGPVRTFSRHRRLRSPHGTRHRGRRPFSPWPTATDPAIPLTASFRSNDTGAFGEGAWAPTRQDAVPATNNMREHPQFRYFIVRHLKMPGFVFSLPIPPTPGRKLPSQMRFGHRAQARSRHSRVRGRSSGRGRAG